MAISRAGISKQLEGRRKTPPRHLEHKVTFGKRQGNRNDKRPIYKVKSAKIKQPLKPTKTAAQIETCLISTEMYIENFKEYAKSQGDYNAHFDSICFEVDSYPIEMFEDMKLGIPSNA